MPAPPSNDRPQLTVVETRARRDATAAREGLRLRPMVLTGALAATCLLIIFYILQITGHWTSAVHYDGGIAAFGLRGILLCGIVPMIVITLAVAVFRPPHASVLGTVRERSLLWAAPLLGLFAGWFVWCVRALLATVWPMWLTWAEVPQLWERGADYLGQSTTASVVVLAVAALLPATTSELLWRGILMPFGAHVRRSRMFDGALVLLAASAALDFKGGIVWIIAHAVAMSTYHAMASTLASGCTMFGFAVGMLTARSLTRVIREALFGMPLIEPARVRVFYVALCLICAVLLLVPASFLAGARRRWAREVPLDRPGGREAVPTIPPVVTWTIGGCAVVLIALMAFELFFR